MGGSVNNVMRNALTQLAGSLTNETFTAIVTACNLPAGLSLGLAQAVARGTMQGVMQNCYDDVKNRLLSHREVEKHITVFDIAERTYFEFAVRDNADTASLSVALDGSYLQQVFETAEHVSIEAIRQSEWAKIAILGRYYGRKFYEQGYHLDFQDMHQMITMTGALTLRQIILIKLISCGFEGQDDSYFITNPSACVEINRLRDYGIWETEGAMFGENASQSIQLSFLKATNYSKHVSEELMLDRISAEDVKRTIDSLKLSPEGVKQSILTEETYTNDNSWHTVDENGNIILDAGKY